MASVFSVYCGLDTNGHDVDSEAIFYELAADFFPHGHSVREEVGRWLSQHGPVTERTLVLTIMADGATYKEVHEKVGRFAGAYKIKAYQEAVLITEHAIDAVFI